jgi:hypothetical protein
MLAALALTLTLSSLADQPAGPPPEQPGSAVPAIALISAGTVVTGISYGGSLAVAAVYGLLVCPFIAAAHERVPTDPFYLFIPVAGPLLINHFDNLDKGTRSLLYLDAAAQAVGIALLIGGFAAAPKASPASLTLLPGPGSLGVMRRF